MLVLTREKGTKIHIEIPSTKDKITITLLDAQGGRARLGIDAPKVYPIARDNVKKRPQQLDLFKDKGAN